MEGIDIWTYPVDEPNDIVWIYQLQGETAAVQALEEFIGGPDAVGHRRCLPRLERWIYAFRRLHNWLLAGMCTSALIEIFAHSGEEERCASGYIDLGEILMVLGDVRSIECFRKALQLSTSRKELLRGYSRLGDAYCILKNDWDSAAASYREAIFVCENYAEAKDRVLQRRLVELDLDRIGRSKVFSSLREDAEENYRFLRREIRQIRLPRGSNA